MKIWTFEDWEIPYSNLFYLAVVLERIRINEMKKERIKLDNGFELGLWRGNTALFWEFANFSMGIFLNNADNPWYFPKVFAIIKLIQKALKEYVLTISLGKAVLKKDEDNKIFITPIGSVEWVEIDSLKRIILANAARELQYFKDKDWFITKKGVTYRKNKIDRVPFYLALEI
jgi:hypothetical protein